MTDDDKKELTEARDKYYTAIRNYGDAVSVEGDSSSNEDEELIATYQRFQLLLWKHKEYIVNHIWDIV